MKVKTIILAALVLTVAGCVSTKQKGNFITYDTDVIPMVIDNTVYPGAGGAVADTDAWAGFKLNYDYYLVNTTTGEEVHNPAVKNCTAFLGGVAVASDGKSEFYIGKDGKKLINEDFMSAGLFSEGIAWVIDKDKKFWAIDRTGKKLFSVAEIQSAAPFYEGRSVLKTRSGFKVVDRNGKVIMERTGLCDDIVVEGLLAVHDSNDNVGLMDMKGNYVLAPDYASVGHDEYSDLNAYINNLRSGKYIVSDKDGNYGVVGRDGNVIIPMKYSEITQDGDLYLVTLNEEGQENMLVQWLDASGNVVIDKNIGFASNFGDGKYAAAFDNDSQKWGFLDREGNWKLEPSIDGFAYSFDANGFAVVSDKNARTGLIDETGKFVISQEYDNITPIKGTDRYIFTSGKNAGIMDKTGKITVNPKYQWAGGIYSGIAPLEYDENFGPHLCVSYFEDGPDEGGSYD